MISTVTSHPRCLLLKLSKKLTHSFRCISLVGMTLTSFFLHTRRERLRHFTGFPLASTFKRLDRARFIEVQHRVELIGQSSVKVMTEPFRLRQIDHTDGSLEPLPPKRGLCGAWFSEIEKEASRAHIVEQRFITLRQSRPHDLALGWSAPA